jgi:hypothetical protein
MNWTLAAKDDSTSIAATVARAALGVAAAELAYYGRDFIGRGTR